MRSGMARYSALRPQHYAPGVQMKDIGRNELCPCGSGKKFKKCHMAREVELVWEGTGEATIEEMGVRIANLPAVEYGCSRQMLAALDLQQLTGSSMGIKFVDLSEEQQRRIRSLIRVVARID